MSTLEELKSRGLLPCEKAEVRIDVPHEKLTVLILQSGKRRLRPRPTVEIRLDSIEIPGLAKDIDDVGKEIVEALSRMGLFAENCVAVVGWITAHAA